jgi:hypothetical protein
MDVLGKNKTAEAYRVSVEIDGRAVVGLVPDAFLTSEYGTGARVSHTEAYEWIAANRHDLTDAIRARLAGQQPRAPYRAVVLEQER